MRLIRIFLPAFLIILFASCNGRQNTKAKIFERREANGGKLLIKYAFKVNDTAITDSTIIDNKALKSDSVNVNYDPKNPADHKVELAK